MVNYADLGLKTHPPQQVLEARVIAEGIAEQTVAAMDYDLNDLAVLSALVLLGGRCCLLCSPSN